MGYLCALGGIADGVLVGCGVPLADAHQQVVGLHALQAVRLGILILQDAQEVVPRLGGGLFRAVGEEDLRPHPVGVVDIGHPQHLSGVHHGGGALRLLEEVLADALPLVAVGVDRRICLLFLRGAAQKGCGDQEEE